MTTYNIQFTTTTALPVRINTAPVGVFGRVVTPERHTGKLVMKLDDDTVVCVDDMKAWSRFGNVRIEPLTPGESAVITREYEFGIGLDSFLDDGDDEF